MKFRMMFKFLFWITILLTGCAQKNGNSINQPISSNSKKVTKNSVTALIFSANSKTLLAGRDDGMIEVWDIKRNKKQYTILGHQDRVNKIAISPNDQKFASVSKDGSIRLWDMGTRKLLCAVNMDYSIDTLAFSADSKHIAMDAVDRHNRVLMIDTECKRIWKASLAERLDDFVEDVFDISIIDIELFDKGPNIKYLAYFEMDSKLLSFEYHPLFTRKMNIRSVQDGSVLSTELRKDGLFNSFDDVLLLPNKNKYLSIGFRGKVRVHNIDDIKVAQTYTFCPNSSLFPVSFLEKMTVSKDGNKALALCNQNELHFYSLNRGELLGQIKDINTNISEIALAPNGKVFATGHINGKIKIRSIRELFEAKN